MSDEEQEAIEILDMLDFDLDYWWLSHIATSKEEDEEKVKKAISVILNLINKLQKENENAKWYIHQMIARLSEDIEDFIDDDREGNKDMIGELKETRKQWQDVEKLLNGESKDNLYNDWRKYGEYE